MVLLWGKTGEETISQCTWALNMDTLKWKKIKVSLKSWSMVSFYVCPQLNEEVKPRAWHIACSRHVQRDIVVFGGNRSVENDYYKRRDAIADLQFISFG